MQGYVRINLEGREKKGIVKKGEEYNQLCDNLIEGLKSYRDEDSLEPVVESTKKSEQLFEKGGGFENIPDLLVKWKYKATTSYRRITSDLYGTIEMPLPGKNLDGRSGNHRPQGFLIAKRKNY